MEIDKDRDVYRETERGGGRRKYSLEHTVLSCGVLASIVHFSGDIPASLASISPEKINFLSWTKDSKSL